MGFGTVAAQIIFFIAVVMVATTLVIVVNEQMRDNADAYRSQSNLLSNQLKSEITILSSSYNSGLDEITIYARNDGTTKLELAAVDLFVGGIRKDRSSTTITVEADTDVGNSVIWDPSEIIEIVLTQELTADIYTIKVVADYGASDQDILSS